MGKNGSRLGSEPRYGWLDTRTRYPREQPPDEIVDSGERRVLVDWSVPLEVASERAALRGTTSWVPAAGPARPSPVSADRGGAGRHP